MSAPEQLFLAVTDVAASKSFSAGFVGFVSLKNSDSTNPLWFRFNAAPAAGSDGDNRTKLGAGESITVFCKNVSSIHAICAGGQTAGLQIVATPYGIYGPGV